MHFSKFALAGCLLILGSCFAGVQGSPTIYFSSGNLIRSTVAGSNVVNPIYAHPTSDGRPMCLGLTDSHLFWTTYYPGQLRRSLLNGSNPQVLVDQGSTTTRAIQFRDSQVYWSNEDLGRIYRANLDGSGAQTVISGYTGYFSGIWDFELVGERIYWVGWDTNRISTTRVDGSDFRVIPLPGVSRAFSLEIENGRMYVADHRSTHTGQILSFAMDGTDRQVLIDGPYALSLSLFGDRIYYDDENNYDIFSVPSSGGLPRVELHQDSGTPWQIAVIPEPTSCCAFIAVVFLVWRRREV